VDSRGVGSEIELLPNADTAWLVGSRRSLPPAAEQATARPPKGQQMTTLAAGHTHTHTQPHLRNASLSRMAARCSSCARSRTRDGSCDPLRGRAARVWVCPMLGCSLDALERLAKERAPSAPSGGSVEYVRRPVVGAAPSWLLTKKPAGSRDELVMTVAEPCYVVHPAQAVEYVPMFIDGEQVGEEHELRSAGFHGTEHAASIWRTDVPAQYDYVFTGDESFYVIEGSVSIELVETGEQSSSRQGTSHPSPREPARPGHSTSHSRSRPSSQTSLAPERSPAGVDPFRADIARGGSSSRFSHQPELGE
jgi:uncharacterized cupin superfamily protein